MWNVCITPCKEFKNVNLIFPTQQRDVNSLILSFMEYKEVNKIVVFGSSITSACNPWSDIDLFVSLSSDVSLHHSNLEAPLDLWTNYTADDRLMLEIEKGVTVYER